jgi:uncharacterized repeat protein (TIGR01451 family)
MKRILFRIAALGTVVALGLIAIAQAQRNGTEKPPQTEAPVFNPLRPNDSAGGATSIAANPLRPGIATAPPVEPSRGQLPFAQPNSPPAASDPPGVAQPPRGAMIDPFGLQSERTDNRVRAAAAQVPAGGDQIAQRPASQDYTAPPPGGGRYLSPPPTADRPAEVRRETSDGQEPAPFTADPRSVPATIGQPPATGRPAASPGDNSLGADAATAGEGTGRPGGKHLEGPQTPQLTIHKIAPPEVQVGKPAAFRILVRNVGPVPAGNVEVRDQLPKGTRFVGSTPRASRGARGELLWNLGTIKPGEESSVEIQLMPTAEGEIGSVASVHFDADASARTIATRPKLVVETTGANRVLIGDQVMLTITVSNPGTGVATGVVIEEHIPAALQHPAGSDLEYPLGDLKPGESRKLELPLTAKRGGAVSNMLTARGEGNLRAESRFDLEVVAPQLDIAMAGPKRRYLEREATYQLQVANPGTAPAQQVELVAYLPDGMKFVSANNAAYYDEANRAVVWRLKELPSNEKGMVELVTLPVEAGQQTIKFRGTAQKGLAVEKEQPVLVEGIAAVLFQMAHDKDPVEVGGNVTYEVRALNQGSKDATNVQVVFLLPPELKPVAAEGPTRHVLDGNRIVFDGVARLAPKGDATFRIRAQGVQPGDLRVRCQLKTAEMQSPVTKEESTRVYADE